VTYLPPVLQIVLALLVLPAGIYDIRWRRVPNWLTLPAILVGVSLNWFLYGTPGLWLSLKGMGLALLVYFPLFAIRAMGAGDAKLMAAVGSVAGPANWLGVFVITALLGGIFAIILLVSTGRIRHTFVNLGYMFRELAFFRAPYVTNEELDVGSSKSVGLPHAAVIGLGTLAFLAAASFWAPR
jgi:prepilin peptidase CpaA